MVTALDLQNKYNQANSGKGGRTAKPDMGKLVPILGRRLNRLVAGGNPVRYELVDGNTGLNPAGRITEAQAAQDATLIEQLAVANHRAVMADQRWQHLYHRAQRNFKFMNPAGNIVRQALWSYPCHYCGFILPEDFIQVDHRQPQRHPGVAVLKVLHAINGAYTTAPAHGTKGTQSAAIANAANPMAIGALNTVAVNGWNWATAWQGGAAVLTANKLQRYTITHEGRTFLAICSMYWGLTATENMCLNNLLNLVPSCGACNGSGGKGSMTHARQ
ncbi:MAG: hypothetical protein H6970_14785 [Gammaproteobacteria bacterium]|nr:hypothetical protein [Gammaproteobacteria bacterium]MCP5458376.1 hypothetical protein [Gammaproteobacteria bacterium]